jgi:putative transposase
MKELKKRKNIRIKEYDYSKEGYYFITICVKERKCILSKIKKRVGQDRPLHNNEK